MGYLEEKQRQLDMRYLRMASIWAENSYCVRRKVGALIVKDKMIISDGYNGTPSGFENVCEDDEGHTKPYVLHAEANAITKVAKSANNCDGSTLYITAAPCIECSKLIIQAGIKRVVYAEDYRSEEGLNLLRRVGIECVQCRAGRKMTAPDEKGPFPARSADIRRIRFGAEHRGRHRAGAAALRLLRDHGRPPAHAPRQRRAVRFRAEGRSPRSTTT